MRSARWAKVRGDLRAARGRVALLIVAVTASLAAVGTVLGAYAIARRELDRNYRDTHPASAALAITGDDRGLAEVARAVPGVADAEARGVVVARVRVGDDWRPLLLFVVDDFAHLRLNTFRPEGAGDGGAAFARWHGGGEDGGAPDAAHLARLRATPVLRGFATAGAAWPPPDGTVLLERTAAAMLGAGPGAALTVRTPHGAPTTVAIAGLVHDPGLAPAWQERTVYAYATRATLAALGEPPELDELRIAVAPAAADDGAAIAATARAVAAALAARGHPVHEIRVPPANRHPHARQMAALMLLMIVFAASGLALSTILVAATVAALLAHQTREIGVLKAIGARPRQVAMQYLALVLVIVVASLAVAVPAGLVGAAALARMVAGLLNFELATTHVPAWVLAVQLGAGVLAPIAAAAVPVARAARVTVRRALDDDGGLAPRARRGLLARAALRLGARDGRAALVARNAVRRPARLALVLGLLAAGGAMFLTARDVAAGWGALVGEVYTTRHYDAELRLVRAEPIDALTARVAAVPGVRAVEAWGRAPAAFATPGAVDVVRTYPDGGHGSFTILGVPRGSRLVDLPPLAGRWLRDDDADDAVVLNHNARAACGCAVGDTALISIDGRPTRLRVVGVVEEVGAAGVAYVTAGALARATGTEGRAALVRVVTTSHEPDARAQAIRDVDDALGAAGMTVATGVPLAELRTAMGGHVVVLVRLLEAMAALFALVGALGLASAMSAAVIERAREHGVLRALGAPPRTVITLVVAEGVVIGAASWLVALALALPLAYEVGSIVGALGFGIPLPLSVSASAAATWLGAVVVGAAAATALPAWQAARRAVRDALARP